MSSHREAKIRPVDIAPLCMAGLEMATPTDPALLAVPRVRPDRTAHLREGAIARRGEVVALAHPAVETVLLGEVRAAVVREVVGAIPADAANPKNSL
jgi:hypothetical protein